MFFLYHNGISITCDNYRFANKKITLSGYQVINGCQSLMTLFQNKDLLSDNIQILTKIIKLSNINSSLIKEITKNANNQNAISLKDLKSNDRVQINLQNTFKKFYGDSVFYVIKRGEYASENQDSISIDYAGQLIKAFYFEEPYKTHLKTTFFGDEYEYIFSNSMNCHKIYLAFIVFNVICRKVELIDNVQVRAYGLARFTLLTIIKKILENDSKGGKILSSPEQFLKKENIEILKKAITKLFNLLVLDYNAYIQDYINSGNFFDYKNLFKNKDFCEKLINSILNEHKKSIVRHPEDGFDKIYESELIIS